MIFNSLGEGTQIQRNIQRIDYVKGISESDMVEVFVNNFIDSMIDNHKVSENIELMFYEKVDEKIINKYMAIIGGFSSEEILKLKKMCLYRFRTNPASGFVGCICSNVNYIIDNK